jgi:hypothetical protein
VGREHALRAQTVDLAAPQIPSEFDPIFTKRASGLGCSKTAVVTCSKRVGPIKMLQLAILVTLEKCSRVDDRS